MLDILYFKIYILETGLRKDPALANSELQGNHGACEFHSFQVQREAGEAVAVVAVGAAAHHPQGKEKLRVVHTFQVKKILH